MVVPAFGHTHVAHIQSCFETIFLLWTLLRRLWLKTLRRSSRIYIATPLHLPSFFFLCKTHSRRRACLPRFGKSKYVASLKHRVAFSDYSTAPVVLHLPIRERFMRSKTDGMTVVKSQRSCWRFYSFSTSILVIYWIKIATLHAGSSFWYRPTPRIYFFMRHDITRM